MVVECVRRSSLILLPKFSGVFSFSLTESLCVIGSIWMIKQGWLKGFCIQIRMDRGASSDFHVPMLTVLMHFSIELL